MKTSKASKLKLPRRRLAPLAAIALGLAWGGTTAQAQGPRPGEARTVEGRVRALTTAPMGELDGATLDDGTTIHWPPHLADRFASVATKGDRVRVVGRTETGPEGDTHFEVQNLTNLRTNAAAEGEEGPPDPGPGRGPGRRGGPPPAPRGPLARRGPAAPVVGASKTVEGRVRALTTAPMGELDGATLDDGTTIHWPPHLADRFASVATKGDRVRVVGRTETGPEGDTHFEVQNLTNLRTNAAAEGEEGPPPPPTGVAPDPSTDFDAPPAARGRDLDRQLKQLEDRIAQLQEEIRRLRGGR